MKRYDKHDHFESMEKYGYNHVHNNSFIFCSTFQNWQGMSVGKGVVHSRP